MHGHAYANGAGTIVNAIAIWKGAAFCIDLKTTADVKLQECAGSGSRITGRSRSTASTLAPSRAKTIAVARPFPIPSPGPCPAPTTMAILSLSRMVFPFFGIGCGSGRQVPSARL